MIWLFILLWPLLGIKPEGLEVAKTFSVWWKIAAGCSFLLVLRQLNSIGAFDFFTKPMGVAVGGAKKVSSTVPVAIWAFVLLAFALIYPQLFGRYAQDVAINCMVYICLGLGLNIVVGLAGMLDLGFIAFYGLGAYTYALLSISYKLAFWICLPISAAVAGLGACIIGYCSCGCAEIIWQLLLWVLLKSCVWCLTTG